MKVFEPVETISTPKPEHTMLITACVDGCDWTGTAIDADGIRLLSKTHGRVHAEGFPAKRRSSD